jgi:hypothetical protein
VKFQKRLVQKFAAPVQKFAASVQKCTDICPTPAAITKKNPKRKREAPPNRSIRRRFPFES